MWGCRWPRSLPFPVDLFRVQNIYYEMLQTLNIDFWGGGADNDEAAGNGWIPSFRLGEKLGVRVAEMKANPIRAAPALVAMAEEVASQRRIPSATYRLQFNPELHLPRCPGDRALPRMPWASATSTPRRSSRPGPGSGHGYDVCDHGRLNPDLGSEEDFDALAGALRDRGMGLVLDVVPNHMGIGHPGNAWWMDVLENGPSSVYARYFDIDWHPVKPELENKVLLPILEDQYGKVLERRQAAARLRGRRFLHPLLRDKLPVAPRTYGAILRHRA